MNFENHYFTEEQIDEFSIGKDSYFTNILRKIGGSNRRRINPKALENLELTPAGYNELFNLLTNKYSDNKKKKYYIKELFQGVFKPKDAEGAFEDLEINDKKQIEVVSYFKLSNGGAIALYNIKDEEDNDRYFIGIDGKGQKFFSAKPKEGGIGMVFKGWLSAQKANKIGTLSKGMTPDKKKDSSPTVKHKIEIDREKFNDIAPEADKIRRLAASNKSLNLLDMFSEEVLIEAATGLVIDGKRAVTIDSNGEWRRLGKSGKIMTGSGSIKKFTDDLIAVDKDGKPSEDLQSELDKKIEEYKKKKADKKDEKPSKEQVDAYGKLYFDIKDELQTKPNEVKSKNVKNGWRYITNNNGTIFVYQSKVDNKYYIAYDDKGKNIVDKYDLINKYNLEKAAEAPE